MKLRGQHGYAMAALLVAMAVMAILLTAVMPVWKQDAQREKEAELVFRGQQYVHAVQLYQRRAGAGTYPPSFDFMVQQKFLRKRYKDPITNSDFLPLPGAAGTAVPGAPAGGAAGSTATIATPGTPTGTGASGLVTAVATSDGSAPGGVAGVMSKSTATSIRIYNGQTHYNEWVFRALAPQPANGAGATGAGGPQRGAQPNQNPQGGGFGGPGGGRGPQRGGPPRGGLQRGFGQNGPPVGAPTGQPPGGRGFPLQQPSGR